MRIVKRRHKRGSILLDAALTFPIVLLVLAAFLNQFLVLQSHILMQRSIDQVTAELACFVPIAGVGTQNLTRILATVTDNASDENVADYSTDKLEQLASIAGKVVGAIDAFGIRQEDILLTLFAGNIVANRIEQTYQQLANQRPVLKNMLTDVECTVSYCDTTRVFWLDVYYTTSDLMGQHVYRMTSCVNIFGHYQFVWDDAPDENDKIWSLHNFDRGRRFREMYGGNLPFNYPVIARWENQTATMIKSIDLTAPGYQQAGSVESKLMHDVRRLAEFNGTDKPWGQNEISIRGEDIVNRKLVIVIPQNATQQAKDELLSCVNTAKAYGVDIEINTYAHSYRYQNPSDKQDTA